MTDPPAPASSFVDDRAALRKRWRAEGWYPAITIGEALARCAEQRPNDQLVFAPVGRDPSTTTLGEIHAQATTTAELLAGAQIESGHAVVVQAAADMASTVVLAALWRLGAVVVPLAVTATQDEVEHAVRQTGARVAVVAPRWRGTDLATSLAAHRSALGLSQVLVLGDEAPRGAAALASLHPQPVQEAGHHPERVACILYTSGSTAEPKGVRHSHETLLSGLNTSTVLPATDGSRTLGTFPAGHVASLLGLLRPLTVGGTTVIMDRWSARSAAELIETYQLTASAGTPFFLTTLLDEAERSGRDISSLRLFLVGAAAVPPALVQRAEAAGILSWRTYGSTEHPSICSGNPTDPADKRRLTDGRPSPGNRVRIVDSDGIDVAPGEEGEIVAIGPKQFLGYQDPSADNDAFFEGGWFRTGDLGRIGDDGYLVVTDRLKDIIIRGGENVSAREIEEVLALHPAVADIAICAMPDDLWGEAVWAYVVLRPKAEVPSCSSLAAFTAGKGLAPHKAPAGVTIVEGLPRTAAGKVRKADLRQLGCTIRDTL
ncbi:MAG: fadK 8 [Mycobacterium sp.]|nr:fadK 8 [Mycobacterium sp.]